MTRPQFLFLIAVSIGIGLIAAFARPPACSDPVGCSWLTPGASLFIGVQRISSGPDRLRSQAILQGAETKLSQAVLLGHPLELYPVDLSCLAGSPDPSAAAIAAQRSTISALGPACEQDAGRFAEVMRAAGKPLLDPIPGLDSTGIARQAAALLARLSSVHHLAVTSLSETDLEIAGQLCQALRNSDQACSEEDTPEAPPDAVLIIAWLDPVQEAPPLAEVGFGKPVIVLSLSRPELPDSGSAIFWLGPELWKQVRGTALGGNGAALPSSFLELASTEAVQILQNALLKTGQPQWDGSLLIPLQALNRQIETEQKSSKFFSPLSIFGSENKIFSLTAFQMQGLEYNDLID